MKENLYYLSLRLLTVDLQYYETLSYNLRDSTFDCHHLVNLLLTIVNNYS